MMANKPEKIALNLKKTESVLGLLSNAIKKSKIIFFKLWILAIRAICVLYVISQSYSVDITFMFYCVAMIFTIKPALGNYSRFKNLSSDLKSLVGWIVFVALSSFTAYASHKIAGTEDLSPTWAYIVMALKTTLLLISTHLMILVVAWFSMRQYGKPKNKAK